MHYSTFNKKSSGLILACLMSLSGCDGNLPSLDFGQILPSSEVDIEANPSNTDHEARGLLSRIELLESELESYRDQEFTEAELVLANNRLRAEVQSLESENAELNQQLDRKLTGGDMGNDALDEISARNIVLQDEVARISSSMNEMQNKSRGGARLWADEKSSLEQELEKTRRELGEVTRQLEDANKQIQALMGEIEEVALMESTPESGIQLVD